MNPGRVPGGAEEAMSDLSLCFSNVLGPSDALSLCFLLFWWPGPLSRYACAAKPPGREFSVRKNFVFFMAFGPWAGNLQGGVCRTFIPDTVYFLPYTVYLFLDT